MFRVMVCLLALLCASCLTDIDVDVHDNGVDIQTCEMLNPNYAGSCSNDRTYGVPEGAECQVQGDCETGLCLCAVCIDISSIF